MHGEPRFHHSSVNELFPTLVWIADLDPAFYKPLNREIMAKIDEYTGPRDAPKLGQTF